MYLSHFQPAERKEMINSNVYDYVNVLGKTADAAWMRNEIIANNLANANTPGYKRQDINFEQTLSRALGESRYESVDSKVRHLSGAELKPQVFTDASNFSYRLDKNNVDPDTESVELAANQIKYNGLLTGINQEFKNLQIVLK